METCKYESDIKRVLKIIDGNGKGLVIKIATMEQTIEQVLEISKINATVINALNKFTIEEKALNADREKREARNGKMIYFVIAQTIVMLGAIVGYFLTQ